MEDFKKRPDMMLKDPVNHWVVEACVLTSGVSRSGQTYDYSTLINILSAIREGINKRTCFVETSEDMPLVRFSGQKDFRKKDRGRIVGDIIAVNISDKKKDEKWRLIVKIAFRDNEMGRSLVEHLENGGKLAYAIRLIMERWKGTNYGLRYQFLSVTCRAVV